jgi:hypothetical protein
MEEPAMNNLREALEEFIDQVENVLFVDLEKENWDIADERYYLSNLKQALQSADTWREPDETTHPYAPLWFTYPGAGGWFPSCNSERENINSMFRGAVFVLAKENQGPPPDDWGPEETWENPFKNEHGN